MSNKSLSLDTLKAHLFDALEGVKNLSDPKASEEDKTSIEQAKAIVDLSGKVIDIYKMLNQMDNVGSLRSMAVGLGVTSEENVNQIQDQENIK